MTQRGAGPAWKAVGARKGVEFKSLVFRRRPRTRCRSQTRASIWIWKLNRRGAEPALNPVRSARAGVRVFRLPPREQKVLEDESALAPSPFRTRCVLARAWRSSLPSSAHGY